MNDSLDTLSWPVKPPEVEEFAAEKGVSPYLNTVIDLLRKPCPKLITPATGHTIRPAFSLQKVVCAVATT
jgi:hypothetical protein